MTTADHRRRFTALYLGDSSGATALDTALERGTVDLDGSNRQLRVESVTDRRSLLDRIDAADCIVIDCTTGEYDGLDVLSTVRDRRPDVPVVLCPDEDFSIAPSAIAADVLECAAVDPADRGGLIRKAIHRALGRQSMEERSRARLQALFGGSPDAIVIHDVEGNVLDVNRQLVSNLGYTTSDVRSMQVTDFEVGADPDELRSIWSSLSVGETRSIEGRHRRNDGTEFPVDIRLTKFAVGGAQRILALCRDVTDRHERESTLRRFQRAIEAAGHAILLTERDGTITYVNPAFEEITGYSAADAIGKTPRILKSGAMSEQFYQKLWETILDGEVWETTIVNRRKSGERYYAHQTIAPIVNEDGTVEEFVGIQTDITERRERERQLNMLDRVLRHNVRNELNVIAAHAEQIAVEADSPIADRAESITDGIEGLVETADKSREITELLSKGRYRRSVDLADVARRVADAADREHPNATVSVDCPDTAVGLAVTTFERVIEELVENAIEHNDRDEPEVELVVSVEGDEIRIHVRDDGPGIPDVERAILDETVEIDDLHHGSGLGLWLAYWIVRRSRGSLEFCERSPRGSDVIVTLERARNNQ